MPYQGLLKCSPLPENETKGEKKDDKTNQNTEPKKDDVNKKSSRRTSGNWSNFDSGPSGNN